MTTIDALFWVLFIFLVIAAIGFGFALWMFVDSLVDLCEMVRGEVNGR